MFQPHCAGLFDDPRCHAILERIEAALGPLLATPDATAVVDAASLTPSVEEFRIVDLMLTRMSPGFAEVVARSRDGMNLSDEEWSVIGDIIEHWGDENVRVVVEFNLDMMRARQAGTLAQAPALEHAH